MINFQELNLEVNETYSFVGIQNKGLKPTFYLPKGFDVTSFTSYASKRDLFFTFYRVLSKFRDICFEKNDKQLIERLKTVNRDGVIQNTGSAQEIILSDNEDEEVIFYSKLDFIASILDAYDEPKILSLAYRLGNSEKVDYSKMHLFLHRAVYLNNGTPYVDSMALPRVEVHFQSTDIVSMYCYILIEVKEQLNEQVGSEITVLAEQFKHKYIGAECELFHEEHSQQVVDVLKEALELIDRNTQLKDVDFWYYYEAIELFLYGTLSSAGDGEIWGINNFCYVWESMCLTCLAKNLDPTCILYIDTTYLADDTINLVRSHTKLLNITNIFNNLRPDAVIYSNYFDKLHYYNKKLLPDNLTLIKDGYYNDYYKYYTMFNKNLKYIFNQDLRIVYKGQLPTQGHTLEKLKEYYRCQNNETVLINSQLPSQFYSFWKIKINDLNTIEDITKVLSLMHQLNHVFYVALKNGNNTPELFYSFLVDELEIENENENENVFKLSLFRDVGKKTPEKIRKSYDDENYEIVLMFDKFVKYISYFKIIDAKYLKSNYFFIRDNYKEIKEKSVRKQFAYEDCLARFISKNDTFRNTEIISEFWLPSWMDNRQLSEDCDEYLNGYIKLKKINFANIIESYLN